MDVTFERGPARTFDIVIGADVLHSRVRRSVFGPEAELSWHLGMYAATLPLDTSVHSGHNVLMYNTPGKAVSLHPGSGHPLAAFMYRRPAIPGFHHRDSAQRKRLLAEAFAGEGWRVPELLGYVADTDDLYFDSVSQVRLPAWSQGRVAVLGDAASCVSLFGDGSTMAMAGAYTPANALAATYQRPVPAIALRNAATRLWPLAAGVAALRRTVRRRDPAPAPAPAGE